VIPLNDIVVNMTNDKKRADYMRSEVDLAQITDIMRLFNFMSVHKSPLIVNAGYWGFCKAILVNIETGIWEIPPSGWLTYYNTVKHDVLDEREINMRLQLYTKEMETLCTKLKISMVDRLNQTLMIEWLKHPKGEVYIQECVFIFVKMFEIHQADIVNAKRGITSPFAANIVNDSPYINQTQEEMILSTFASNAKSD